MMPFPWESDHSVSQIMSYFVCKQTETTLSFTSTSHFAAMSVAVVDVRRLNSPLTFPAAESGNLLYVDDAVALPEADVAASAAPGDLAEAVFFSLSTLADLLSEEVYGYPDHVINSKVNTS